MIIYPLMINRNKNLATACEGSNDTLLFAFQSCIQAADDCARRVCLNIVGIVVGISTFAVVKAKGATLLVISDAFSKSFLFLYQ